MRSRRPPPSHPERRTMEYRGYKGVAEYDPRDEIFYGHIIDVERTITFEAVTAQNVVRAFRKEVDRYIEAMRGCEEEPETPRPSAPIARAAPVAPALVGAGGIDPATLDPTPRTNRRRRRRRRRRKSLQRTPTAP